MRITDKWIEDNIGLVWKAVNKYKAHDEDLFQIALLGAIESAPQFDETREVEFTSFIFTCMCNKIANQLRMDATARRGGGITFNSLDYFNDTDGIEYEHLTDSFNMEDRLYIENILNDSRLSEKQSEVIRLHILHDLSFAEIARLKGQTRQAVYSLFKYGISKVTDKIIIHKIA